MTPDEDRAGLGSAFSSDTAGQIRSVSIEDGVATIDFTDSFVRTSNFSTSNLSAVVSRQIETTVFQFLNIDGIDFRVNGKRWCGWETTCEGAPVPLVTRTSICAAAGAADPVPPPEIPAATAETFSALARAAIACDFDELALLASDDFVLNWGGQADLADEFTIREVSGHPAISLVLVELLRLPPARNAGLGNVWLWPGVHATPMDEPTLAQREELAAIYRVPVDDVWSEYGPIGRFIGIDDAGNWLYYAPVD